MAPWGGGGYQGGWYGSQFGGGGWGGSWTGNWGAPLQQPWCNDNQWIKQYQGNSKKNEDSQKRKRESTEATCKGAKSEKRMATIACRTPWEDIPDEHRDRSGQALFETLQALRPVEKEMFFSDGTWNLKAMYLRLQDFIDEPTEDLRLAPDRHIHVGLMDYMGESHEGYRKELDFLETTNTWFDTDTTDRQKVKWLPDECGWQDVAKYYELSARVDDGFRLVVKVSHVATHLLELQQPQQWWPKLWEQKYSHIANGAVAFLWQFAPRFKFNPQNLDRLKNLFTFLATKPEWKQLRHIVDFRNSSWYKEAVYAVLRNHNVCLAWLHLQNTGWASDLPNGWTPGVLTSDFTFIRLFGNQDRCTGWYDTGFLHNLYEKCPKGMHSYVLFGNKATLVDPEPVETPCFLNARDFRRLFSRVDLVSRVRDVRYEGACPRQLNADDAKAVTSFFIRYSEKGRAYGIRMSTPVFVVDSTKFYKNAKGKRSYEWHFADGKEVHLSLHDANDQQDILITIRQFTGMEEVNTVETFCCGDPRQLSSTEALLVNSTFIRFSPRARKAGILRTTPVCIVSHDGQPAFQWFASSNAPTDAPLSHSEQKGAGTCSVSSEAELIGAEFLASAEELGTESSTLSGAGACTLSIEDLRIDMEEEMDIWAIYCDLRNGIPSS